MKAYRCSECTALHDYDEYVMCAFGIDPRPNHREKGDAELCKNNFKPLDQKEQWHKKFSWEQAMTKQELIEKIEELPDDIQVFIAPEGKFDDIDIRIFTTPKDKEFINWYFGP